MNRVKALNPINSEALSISILEIDHSYEAFYPDQETAFLILEGEASADYQNQIFSFQRTHWREENPSVFHLCAGDRLTLHPKRKSRFAVVQTENSLKFPSRYYAPEAVETEHRGKGILNDSCYRQIRLVFDRNRSHENVKLVLGEVVNRPGAWSSYPPHHHEQDEVYYYELDPPEGFAFGQCGEKIYKIEHQKLLYIPGGQDHAQVSAPGYALYYIWAIRHGVQAYTGFEYTKPYDKVLNIAAS